MGLPGAGKTTLSKHLAPRLNAVHFNADDVRANINRDLGFSEPDRIEHARRMGWLCDQVVKVGCFAIADFICPLTSEQISLSSPMLRAAGLTARIPTYFIRPYTHQHPTRQGRWRHWGFTVGNEMTERYRRRSRTITILDAIADPQLFGQHFRDHVTWAAWCVFLCALFVGLPLTSEQISLSSPMLRAAGKCFSRAASGHAAAAPSSVMNSRRFIQSPR